MGVFNTISRQAIAATILLCAVFTSSSAQAPAAYSSADIYLQLKKLNVLGSVLYIAAHPDDENTRLLAYFSKEKLYRTGYLSLTRGDGGQNLIGDEQGIDLGLIRTQELLSARRIDGAEQFFSRAYDFGFCKTADEALKTWDHDKILSDVVWVIRKFQPDVIITRFPGDERAGHGHHAASAILAKEAFTAAADPTKFPEQLKNGVQTWQAKRILWNTFNFGNNNTTTPDQFKLDVGVYNSLLGKSYGEIASESRSQHKSQGFGVQRQRGQIFDFFSLTAGDSIKDDLFNGVSTSWKRVDAAANIQSQIDAIINAYEFAHPENSVSALVKLFQSLQSLPDSYWKNKKLDEVRQLVLNCCGLFAEATTSTEFAIAGQKFNVQFLVDNRLDHPVQLKNVKLLSFDSTLPNNLPNDQNVIFQKAFNIDATAPVTEPYWLQYPLEKGGSFTVNDQQLIGKAQNDPAFMASFTFTIDGTDINVQRPVQYKFTDPVKGEMYEPFIVVHPLSVSIEPPVILTNVKQQAAVKNDEVHVQVKSNITAPQTPLNLSFVQGTNSTVIKDTVVDLDSGKMYDFYFFIDRYYQPHSSAAVDNSPDPGVAVQIKLDGYRDPFTENLHSIQYDHIPYVHYYAADKIHVVNDEVKIVGKHIGYIAGAGDKVMQSLQQMGYVVTVLNEKDVTAANLKQFDAVITGVRAYNVHDWLPEKYDILMNYVQNGGNLIVQYNTNNQISSIRTNIGPYSFSISRTRVTDENADVHILLPDHPALNFPNKITADDFKGWVQERSTYHAEQLDSHYEAPLGMHDPNDTESNGALVIAKYGKGNFVYTGLVFFRQLPSGVPGAYRLMANLIALPKNKAVM
ncbi:MAG TPA: PIG-L family deacetylase [Parafilimonas sp.]|nr:PIG-L family deacetylase [Parafilimonas sp.]